MATVNNPAAEDLVPLKPLVFQILLVLIEGERHGYSIVKEVEAATSNRLKVEPGNLYRTIRTMLSQGLIAEVAPKSKPHPDDQRRRYFGVTPLGDQTLRLEAKRMEELALAAQSRLAKISHVEGDR